MTADTLDGALVGHFSTLENPGEARKCRHKLVDLVVIASAAVSAFGCAKKAWFRPFLELPNGIPAHYTFGRVFALPAFEACFRAWVAASRQ